jgi:glucose 1-dehydrogenase
MHDPSVFPAYIRATHLLSIIVFGPGAINTDLDAPTINDPPTFARLLSEIPLGRVDQPIEVARLAAYLASDAAGYITGSTCFVDSGMLCQSGRL